MGSKNRVISEKQETRRTDGIIDGVVRWNEFLNILMTTANVFFLYYNIDRKPSLALYIDTPRG